MTTSPGSQSAKLGQDGPDAGRHRTQMGRDVRCLRDHAARAVKERAGKVEPFLDIGRVTGAAQGDAHLLGHAGEAVADRVHSVTGFIVVCTRFSELEPDVAILIDPGVPARRNDRGRVELEDTRRAREAVARLQPFAVVERWSR